MRSAVLPASFTTFFAASVSRRRRDLEAAVREHLAALLDVRAFEAHDHRHLDVHLLHGGDDAFGDHVAAHDAAEDVHEDRLHVLVRRGSS